MKKITALILSLLMIFSVFTLSSYATGVDIATQEEPGRSSIIATIIFRNFYGSSGSSTINVGASCNYISFKFVCSSTDTILVIIEDLNTGICNTVLNVPGDGTTNTYSLYFASGAYRVTCYGDSSILHSLGLVAFST